MDKKAFSVIGTGAVGSVLARVLAGQGFPLKSLFNRSESSLANLAKGFDLPIKGLFPKKLDELGELIFITVSDDEIENVANRLASLPGDVLGCYFVHCSGSKTSGILSALHKKGAAVASFHPLQTFTTHSNPSVLQGIYFDMEGDKEALSFLEELANGWESTCIRIDAGAKPYLHAAAVMASNYVVALLASAGTIAEMGGMNQQEIHHALLPLVQQSVKNMGESNQLLEALSGPIARGDASTVADHLKLLEQNPKVLTLYKQLGSVAAGIAGDGGKISEEKWKIFSKMFER